MSNARRQGDLDSSQSILADTFKLLDNSAYGKSLTNIAKHRDIHYVTSEQTKKLVNESRFQKLTELSEDLAEAEMSKKKINWALALQIGYFVYQYAKLRMLQFCYDFLDKFVSREDFQVLEMGTDSLYMALSRERFEDAVRPHLREQFYKSVVSRAGLWQTPHRLSNDTFSQATMEPLLSVQTALTVFDMIKEHQACSKQNTQEIPLWGFVPKHISVSGRKVKTNSAAKVSTNNTPHSPKIPINKFLKHKRVAGEGQISVLKRTEKPCLLTHNRKSFAFVYIKRVVGSDGISTFPTSV